MYLKFQYCYKMQIKYCEEGKEHVEHARIMEIKTVISIFNHLNSP